MTNPGNATTTGNRPFPFVYEVGVSMKNAAGLTDRYKKQCRRWIRTTILSADRFLKNVLKKEPWKIFPIHTSVKSNRESKQSLCQNVFSATVVTKRNEVHRFTWPEFFSVDLKTFQLTEKS